MGLFGIFKRSTKHQPSAKPVIELPGPAYLGGFFKADPGNRNATGVWQAKLVMPSGNTKFKINYYGRLHEIHKNLIVGTTFAPALILAVDVVTGEEILLFDGCKHGYNALFCDNYTIEQIEGRSAGDLYSDKSGKTIFEISIMTTNSIDYEEEGAGEVDSNGFIELPNGQKMAFDVVKRNGYDSLFITATNEDGTATEIVSEELA